MELVSIAWREDLSAAVRFRSRAMRGPSC